MIIQVVGLPCSGKSYYIDNFLLKNPQYNLIKKDITNYSGKNREFLFYKDILKEKSLNQFVESACGLSTLKSIVVLVRASKENYRINTLERDTKYTKNDLEQIESQIIPATYTVYNQDSFEALIHSLLGEKSDERINYNSSADRSTIL